MRISRLFLPGDYQENQSIALPKEQAHYALTVLRLKNDYVLEAFNGEGLLATGKLIVTSRRTADFQIEKITEPKTESPLNLTLVQGISRGDRMDYTIQKAVELGVTCIQPLITERCEVKLSEDKIEKRRAQWQSIAINACEQSGRTVIPQIRSILNYSTWLEMQTVHDQPFGLVLDPYAKDRLATVQQPPENIAIHLLIGPEGGLTDLEVQQAKQAGLSPVQLGPRILRTETAGPAVLAILQSLWGDF